MLCCVYQGDIGRPGIPGLKAEKGEKGSIGKRGRDVSHNSDRNGIETRCYLSYRFESGFFHSALAEDSVNHKPAMSLSDI